MFVGELVVVVGTRAPLPSEAVLDARLSADVNSRAYPLRTLKECFESILANLFVGWHVCIVALVRRQMI